MGEEKVMAEGLERESSDSEVSKTRREIIKMGVVASAILTLGGLVKILEPITVGRLQPLRWPRIRVANVKDLNVDRPIIFNYPLTTTPNILVKLGQEAETGIGPDKDIVAFSQLCQHQGCLFQYTSSGKVATGFCPCHRGTYDLLHNAMVIGGPVPRPVPAAVLEYQASTGDIYAIGMKPPVIYGHGPPGSDDVDLDLIGGELVGNAVG